MSLLLTEELLAKIDRFAEREAKVVVSKFHRFANAVVEMDLSNAGLDRHFIRDMITHIAEKYGLEWLKLDTDDVLWQYAGNFKVDKNLYVPFWIGFEIDYYDVSSDDLATVLPFLVFEKFATITLEKAKTEIRESIIVNSDQDDSDQDEYWD